MNILKILFWDLVENDIATDKTFCYIVQILDNPYFPQNKFFNIDYRNLIRKCYLKMGHPRPLSLFLSFQYTVDSKQMFNINK